MAGDGDAGVIVLNRSGEELASIAADAMLFLAVLLLAYTALQVAAIADTEAERLRLEQQQADAAGADGDVFVRCDWGVEDGEIRVAAGNAGGRPVIVERVTVAARDAGGADYVDAANLTRTVLLPAGGTEAVFLGRDRFDGERVEGVTLGLVADAGPMQERARIRVTVRCSEAADWFLRIP